MKLNERFKRPANLVLLVANLMMTVIYIVFTAINYSEFGINSLIGTALVLLIIWSLYIWYIQKANWPSIILSLIVYLVFSRLAFFVMVFITIDKALAKHNM